MRKQMTNVVSISFCFGCISYVISGYFLKGAFPIIMGIITWALFTLVLCALTMRNDKRQAQILSGIEQEILMQDSVNCYGPGGLANGILFLTKHKLCFYESEKSFNKYEYALDEISSIEYGRIFRHISGCIVTTRDSDKAMFAMAETEYSKWFSNIQSLRYS